MVALDSLTNRQRSLVKGHLVDLANKVNECFPSFNPLNSEFSPGLRVIDNFSDHISFNLFNKEKDDKLRAQLLDEMVLESSSSSSVAIIASDVSIKNNVAMLSGMVHTGVEVHRMDSKMSGLVERPWLQLMCCTVCLPRGRNFR